VLERAFQRRRKSSEAKSTDASVSVSGSGMLAGEGVSLEGDVVVSGETADVGTTLLGDVADPDVIVGPSCWPCGVDPEVNVGAELGVGSKDSRACPRPGCQ
jgi:hypothetical protein